MFDLTGTWVTSFSGFVHDDPMDPKVAPQFAAYHRRKRDFWLFSYDVYDRTAGYFPAATMLCLKFAPASTAGTGALTGKVRINRGGRVLVPNDAVTGQYNALDNTALGITEGRFHTIYSPAMPDPTKPDIRLDYEFIARSPDEIEWIWWKSSSPPLDLAFRASVAQGTLRRVVSR